MKKIQFIFYSVQFNQFYLTSIEKQDLTTLINLARFCFTGTTPILSPNVWANENPKVDTCSRESNSGPQDREADALPLEHGHLIKFKPLFHRV